MSGGGNGLRPQEVLARKEKCPDSPSKHKYSSAEDAWKAARERSKATGLEIVAYLCTGCGYSHLTKSSLVNDKLVPGAAGVGVTTVTARKRGVLTSKIPTPAPIVRLQPAEEEMPIVAANKDARRKMIAQVLQDNPTPTMKEITAAVPGFHAVTLSADLKEMGYFPQRVKGSQSAIWAPKDYVAAAAPRKPGRKSQAVLDERRKALDKLLLKNPTPSSPEIQEALDVSAPTARKEMKDRGYRPGKHNRWHLPDQEVVEPDTEAPVEPVVDEPVVEATLEEEVDVPKTPTPLHLVPAATIGEAMERHPAGHDVGWLPVDTSALGDMPLSQVLAVLRATGMEIQFQVRTPHAGAVRAPRSLRNP